MTSAAALRRISAIGRAELILFVRNPTIWMTALLPLAMVAVLGPALGNSLSGSRFVAFLVTTLATWSLLLVIYTALTMVLVARREEGMLQRMSTGEATPWESVIGVSLPTAVIAIIQILLGGIAAALAFGAPTVVNPVLPVIAVLACVVILIGLAAWTSSMTSTVEGASYSTMPVLMVLFFFSGTIPLNALPDAVGRIGEATPLWAMSDLISLGLTGFGASDGMSVEPVDFLGSWAPAARPLTVLAAWILVSMWLARTQMRFTRRK